MPELTLPRGRAGRALARPVCMYCGAPATAAREVVVEHRPTAPDSGGGTDLTPVPTGDDPVSVGVALVMLPFALWDLLVSLIAGAGALLRWASRPRAAAVPAKPARPVRTTVVEVTTCDRHRRFGARFAWAWAAGVVALLVLWAAAVAVARPRLGTDDTGPAAAALLTAVFATVLVPVGLGFWQAFAGPVIVERVTENAVVLDRVRAAYFTAAGIEPG